MPADTLVRDLHAALAAVPLIDPHSHIDPLAPGRTVARRHPRLPLLHGTGPLRRHEPGAARQGRAAAGAGPRDRPAHGPLRQHGPVRLVPRHRPHVPRLHRRPRHRRRRRHAVRRGREGVRPARLGAAGLREDEARKDLPDQRVRRPARGLRHRRRTSPACAPTPGLPPRQAGDPASGWRRRPASRSATRRRCGRRSAKLFEHFTPQGGEGVRHLAAAGLRPGPVRRRALYEQMRSTTATTSRRASSGCSPSTAASSGCRST